MAAPERFAKMSDFSLAPRAPSIHGTKRHFAAAQQTVALGVKADMGGDATGRLSTIGLQALDTELGEDKNRRSTTWSCSLSPAKIRARRSFDTATIHSSQRHGQACPAVEERGRANTVVRFRSPATSSAQATEPYGISRKAFRSLSPDTALPDASWPARRHI